MGDGVLGHVVIQRLCHIVDIRVEVKVARIPSSVPRTPANTWASGTPGIVTVSGTGTEAPPVDDDAAIATARGFRTVAPNYHAPAICHTGAVSKYTECQCSGR